MKWIKGTSSPHGQTVIMRFCRSDIHAPFHAVRVHTTNGKSIILVQRNVEKWEPMNIRWPTIIDREDLEWLNEENDVNDKAMRDDEEGNILGVRI